MISRITTYKGGLEFPLYWLIDLFFAVRIDEGITFKEAMLFIPNRVSEDLIFLLIYSQFLLFIFTRTVEDKPAFILK